MSLEEYKGIYFLEFYHRWIARGLGVFFVGGLALFAALGALRKRMVARFAGPPLKATGEAKKNKKQTAKTGFACAASFCRAGLRGRASRPCGNVDGEVGIFRADDGSEDSSVGERAAVSWPSRSLCTPDDQAAQRVGVCVGVWFDCCRVSPYRLAFHLLTATGIYVALIWNALTLLRPAPLLAGGSAALASVKTLERNLRQLGFLAATTFASGAFVAGNDAGLSFNSWPKMGDE